MTIEASAGSKITQDALGIPRLSSELQEYLTTTGLKSYFLTGQETIRSLRQKRLWQKRENPFWGVELGDEAEHERSMRGWIVFDPKRLFLPDSNQHDYIGQVGMIEESYPELQKKGMRPFMGGLSTLAEIVLKYSEETGTRLLGEIHNYYYVRTKTPVKTPSGDTRTAIIGNHNSTNGIALVTLEKETFSSHVFATALFTPQEPRILTI